PSLAPYSFHQCHLGLVKMATRPSTRRRKSSSENRAQNATVVLSALFGVTVARAIRSKGNA
ncbi:hypothetical protein, partial [Pseudoruegeria sp. SK021]|uniref:hypothetical protein n=1 Tax=Pseudoruegeria sp. SK021 TaxID=1933035 RepID=UPI001981940E